MCYLEYTSRMKHASPFHARALRGALIDMLTEQNFTHAVTLNTDRELSASRLRDIFKTFCMNLDRRAHAKQNVRNIPSSERLLAIAFPENLATNAHLHAVADFSRLVQRTAGHQELEEVIARTWKKATRKSGSVHLSPQPDSGWSRYITKMSRWPEPLYWISTDFHPF